MAARAQPVKPRFDERYAPEPNSGCWLWTHTTFKTGYGSISVNGRPTKAHRVSWALHHGQDPGQMHVLHKCDVPLCVNPDHLFLGTHAENMADMARKGSHNARVTPDQVRAIYHDHRPISAIAADYRITNTSVSNIKRRITWQHISMVTE
jgi:hypothetical protein